MQSDAGAVLLPVTAPVSTEPPHHRHGCVMLLIDEVPRCPRVSVQVGCIGHLVTKSEQFPV